MDLGLNVEFQTGWLTWCFNWTNTTLPLFHVRPSIYSIENGYE